MNDFVLKGNICFSKSKDELVCVNGYLVCSNGLSLGVFEKLPLEYKDYKLYDYGNYLIIPGLIDLHIHAPQYAYRGLGMDYELLDWLKYEAFKEESKSEYY